MSAPLPAARTFRYDDLVEGRSETHEYVITEDVYRHFLAAFDDRSPIHVDEPYALACGYQGSVMHGAIFAGFLSHFVGMYFPGRLSLLISIDLRLKQPSYLHDAIRLDAVVTQKADANKVIVLDLKFHNTTRNCAAARARVQVQLRDEP
jgi:3-hydroxybutyryl-CoA dehydratase